MAGVVTSLLAETPFVVFLAVFLGVLLGEVEVRGVSLGVSGVLFAGLSIGALDALPGVSVGVERVYLELSLVLFIAAVGLLAAADIGGVLRSFGPQFVAVGVAMTLVAAGFNNFCTALFGPEVDPWLLRGTFAGAVSSSPALAAGLEVAPEQGREAMATGYAVAYPVGILTIILFEQFTPQLTRLDMDVERRRFAATIGQVRRIASESEASVPFSLAGFALAVVLGVVVGMVPVPLGPLGTVTLGASGGTLVAALAVGTLPRAGPVETRMDRTVLVGVREVAIGVFLAVVGLDASSRFVAALLDPAGVAVVASAVLTGVGTMVIGFVLAAVVWEFDYVATAGAISGGMTSTPGLGAAIAATDTEEVGATYGATYPFALLAKVVVAKLLVLGAV